MGDYGTAFLKAAVLPFSGDESINMLTVVEGS
jgi:hypothetical protein